LAVRVGKWYAVKWLKDYFVSHGCTYDELPNVADTPYGLRRIRFIVDPTGKKFVTLLDLDDDESVPESIYGNWELILGVELPKNNLAC
jgi:hypothetical protein